MVRALVDADIVAYRCAVIDEDEYQGCRRADTFLEEMFAVTQATSHKLFFTGADNFRYNIDPQYKANRKNVPKPVTLNAVVAYCVENYPSKVSLGCEADDLMAMEQDEDSVICSIDKDMLQVPGAHYNFVKKEFKHITLIEGRFNFYWQCIMGDKADNIFGFDGLARVTMPKKMEWMYSELQEHCMKDSEVDAYNFVLDLYSGDEPRLLMNAQCLWLQRTPDQMWQVPLE